MKKFSSQLISLALSLSFCAGARAQQPTPTPAQSMQQVVDEEDVVRITANLVQFDAVVLDKSGRQVTDLRPEDFQVLEDGKPQPVTNLSYVSLDNRTIRTTTAAAVATNAKDRTAQPPPVPMPLRPEQVRRTIALVIDDLGLSFESMAQVRGALRKYVDEQMQPNDLVAIIRTSAGMGALQQFTNDKRVLYAAIERIKWYPLGRGGVSAFAAVEPDPVADANQLADVVHSQSSGGGGGLATPVVDQARAQTDLLREVGNNIETYREEIFSVGTLGALNFVVKGLRELPGRKSAILFSDGISILKRDAKSERVLESMRRLVDLANRASVVIYTMDARGLQTLAPTAQDNFQGRNGQEIRKAIDDRTVGYFESKNGLNYLAQQTGGIFFENENNLAGGVQRVLDDQRGFYLIGYRPEPSTFDAATGRRSFHQIDVKVKRAGLRVRTRNGFYGFTDEEAKPQRAGREQQLYGALSSPFNTGEVGVRLTTLYGHDAQTGAFMRALLYIDGANLTFKQQPDGTYRSDMDVLALTFGEAGQSVDEYNATLAWTGDERAHQNVLRGGLVYVVNVPVKKPGPYQLRIAVRDAATERVGAANQFIEVPDLADGRLTLSGLVISGADEAQVVPAATKAEAGTQLPADTRTPAPLAAADLEAGPALRRLRPGMALYYNYAIYNAQGDTARRPQLQTQARLYRDGQLIYTGKPLPVETEGQPDARHLLVGGRMKLGASAAPGQYVLQVVVTDALARNNKHATATQWLDFEIVK